LPGLWLLTAAACADGGADASARRPGLNDAANPTISVVDSVRPIEEEIARFRAGLEPVTALHGGTTTLDSLVRGYVAAVAANDTCALLGLFLDRAEFIYLYYPETKYTRPPYRQAPDLVWYLTKEGSEKGLGRALRRMGGTPLRLLSYECTAEPERVGDNQIWSDCLLELDTGAEVRNLELFGAVIERRGRFKFLSYANDL
jgi:hypothetical protein